MVEPAVGAAAGLGRWFVGSVVLPVCGDFQGSRQHSATTAQKALPVCELLTLGMQWGTARSNRAAAGLGRSFVRVMVLPVYGDFQTRRQHSASTAHRALPVCEWSALGTPWGTARSNEALIVCSSCGGAWIGGYGSRAR